MRDLKEYDAGNQTRLPDLDYSLSKKRDFVERFFICGDVASAYNEVFAPNMSAAQARAAGNALMESDQFIRDLMSLARKNVVGSVTTLLADHTSILAELRDGAKRDGKWAPAIAAEIARGKALGLYDRVGAGNSSSKDPQDMSSAELKNLLESVMRLPQGEREAIASMLKTEDAGLLEGDYTEI